MSASGPFDVSLNLGSVAEGHDEAEPAAATSEPSSRSRVPKLAVRAVERTRKPPAPAVAMDARRLLTAAGLIASEAVEVTLATSDGVWTAVTPGSPVVVGRRADQAQLVVGDTRVSRRHCRVQVDDHGAVTVEDLGSANGTWIHRQDQRILLEAGRPAPLEDGDWIRSGDLAVAHVTITRGGR